MNQVSTLEEWLGSQGLGEYAERFAEHHVGLEDLPHLTGDDLKECGVASLPHRKRLLEAIRLLSESPVTSEAAEEVPAAIESPWHLPSAGAASGGNLFIPPVMEASPTAFAPAAPVYGQATPGMPVSTSSAATVFSAPVAGVTAAPPPRRSFWARLLASKFLFYSIVAHFFFGVGATYFIVQSVQAKRKLTFQGGPPTTNPSKHALEHKVSMAQKKKTGGAPPQAKRIATTGLSKIALPEMPTMPTATTVVPGMAAGMGGVGMGQGMGIGNGAGSGSGGGGGGGNFSFFGFRGNGGTGGMIGTLWDLKQTHGHKPTKIGEGGEQTPLYFELVKKFSRDFHEGNFAEFYKVPQALSTTQIMVPNISADEGPKAFGAEKEVKPGRWVALYKAKVSPPKSGTYSFVGAGDDVLLVRFNGKLVLDGCWGDVTGWKPKAVYHNGYPHPSGGYVKGDPMHVEAGQFYDLEILIGERPGGLVFFCLEIEEEGATYRQAGGGYPVLPLFRTANVKIPELKPPPPEFDPNGPLWKIQAPGTGSLLDALKR